MRLPVLASLLLMCGCLGATPANSAPADLDTGDQLSKIAGGGDLASAGRDLAMTSDDQPDLASPPDLASRDLVTGGDLSGGSCVRGSDCPGSGSAGCCGSVEIAFGGGNGSVNGGGMCGDPCSPGAVMTGEGSTLAFQTKLCADTGDCGNYYGSLQTVGIVLFDSCCSAKGLAQKFCANRTAGEATGLYTCN